MPCAASAAHYDVASPRAAGHNRESAGGHRVGPGVRIYQGVSLGATGSPLNEQGRPITSILRTIVEAHAAIYAAVTTFGRITFPRGVSIGSNVCRTRDVPPGSRVTQTEVGDGRHWDGSGI